MSEKRFKGIKVLGKEPNEIFIKDKEKDYYIRTEDEVVKLLNEQQATIEHLKERLYDFEKRKIIEESEINEDVIPKVKMLRTELFGEKYE